jgi:ribose 5-phosphate isomerase B
MMKAIRIGLGEFSALPAAASKPIVIGKINSSINLYEMKIAVAADHAGFELKNHLRDAIEKLGHAVTDLGAYNAEPSDYPDFAEAIGKAVHSGQADRGVLICGSGVGASIAANKIHGIRAAICHDTYSAHQGVEHDNMNILVLGSRVIGRALAEDLVKAFLNAQFTNEERHVRRLEKVNRLESNG